MSLDTQVTAAFLAAIQKVETGCHFSNLAFYRRQKIKKMAGTSSRMCECDETPKVPVRRSFIPVFEVSKDEKFRPQFRCLPLMYIPKFKESKFLPFLEICEVPFVVPFAGPATLDALERRVEGSSVPLPVTLKCDKDSLVDLTPEALWSVRKQVVKEATSLFPGVSAVYLDVFEPPSNINPHSQLAPLFDVISRSLDSEQFERHHDKMINSYLASHVYFFRLRSFLMSGKRNKSA